MYKYGFIGTGNMGAALASALIKKNGPENIALSNRTPEKAADLANSLGCKATTNADISRNSRYIILGVKPQTLPAILREIRGSLIENIANNISSDDGNCVCTGHCSGDVEDMCITPDGVTKPILVTMAAGVKMDTICSTLDMTFPVIRIMPNTPVSIGEGVILAAKNSLVSDAEFTRFISDFEKAGIICPMEEEMIDAGSVISGCGPAYIYMYIDALAKAGESLGLPYEVAATLAKATARGAAALSEQSTKNLETLRENVCSPGGSTIEGVKSLNKSNINSIVEEALGCAYKRTKELAGE